jgi:hypothetical protein
MRISQEVYRHLQLHIRFVTRAQGSYNTTNSRTNTTVNTTSDANTLVIPPVQSIASWAEGAATSRIGANGDCGTATATGSGTFL